MCFYHVSPLCNWMQWHSVCSNIIYIFSSVKIHYVNFLSFHGLHIYIILPGWSSPWLDFLISSNIWYPFLFRTENVWLTDKNHFHTFKFLKPIAAWGPLGFIWLYITGWSSWLSSGQVKLPFIVWSASCRHMPCCCCWLECLLDYCWTIFYQIFYPRLVCTGSSEPIVSLILTEIWASADYTASSL